MTDPNTHTYPEDERLAQAADRALAAPSTNHPPPFPPPLADALARRRLARRARLAACSACVLALSALPVFFLINNTAVHPPRDDPAATPAPHPYTLIALTRANRDATLDELTLPPYPRHIGPPESPLTLLVPVARPTPNAPPSIPDTRNDNPSPRG